MKKFTILMFFTFLSNIVLSNKITVIELHNKSLDQLVNESLVNNDETQIIISEDIEMNEVFEEAVDSGIENLTQENILKLNTLKKIEINGVKLNIDDVYITREPSDRENKYLMSSGNFSINLSTELTNELIEERIAREIVSSIQKKRKESGMKITDRISISLNAEDGLALNAINKYTDYIKKETLCTKLNIVEKDMEDSILDFKIYISITKN